MHWSDTNMSSSTYGYKKLTVSLEAKSRLVRVRSFWSSAFAFYRFYRFPVFLGMPLSLHSPHSKFCHHVSFYGFWPWLHLVKDLSYDSKLNHTYKLPFALWYNIVSYKWLKKSDSKKHLWQTWKLLMILHNHSL